MSRTNYLPKKFSILLIWLTNFIDTVTKNLERFGIPIGDLDKLREQTSDYQTAYYKAEEANAGSTDRLDRKQKAETISKAVRRFVNQHLRFNPAVTDDDRSDLGLTIPDKKQTPAAPINTEPVGTVDFSVHQQHTLKVKDSHHSGRAKPDHAKGFEVWHKFGTPPEHDDDFQYTGFSSTSRMKINYPLEIVGQTVFYRFRWINTRNLPGPWSETISAVIA